MADSHTPNPQLILPVGTQIVLRIEILDAQGRLLCPRGAVGVITGQQDPCGCDWTVCKKVGLWCP